MVARKRYRCQRLLQLICFMEQQRRLPLSAKVAIIIVFSAPTRKTDRDHEPS
jgi:hypothetical protein